MANRDDDEDTSGKGRLRAATEPSLGDDSAQTREQRYAESEIKMLRQASAQNSQILSVVLQMVSRLEARLAESESRTHERLDTVHRDLDRLHTDMVDIKEALHVEVLEKEPT